MILAFVLALLAVLATGALLLPLVRRPASSGGRFEHALAIYRDQLAEIDRDLAAGRLAASEAAGARLEIERRILAASETDRAPAAAPGRHRLVSWLIALAVPGVALLVYFEIGHPELPAQPFASRPAVQAEGMAEAERLLAVLRQRVAEAPEDAQRHVALGRAFVAVGRPGEAVPVLREALRRGGSGPELNAQLAEALTLAADGVVVPEAQEIFRQVLAQQPGDPRAHYYLGRADEQAGNSRAALQRWLDLEVAAPDNAPWLGTVTAEIDRLAKTAGIDPRSIRPDRKVRSTAPAGPQPSRDDMARMQQLSPQERERAIRTMVEGLEARLEAAPDDVAGWQRLANAWKVLNEPARALAALERADKLKPDDAQILGDMAELMIRAGDPARPPSLETAAVLRRLEKVQPDNGLALFYLAEDALAAGDRAGALTRFRRLLELMPPDAALRPTIEKRLRDIELPR
jgi:cytochrome c-type biogenesis protein CcmH